MLVARSHWHRYKRYHSYRDFLSFLLRVGSDLESVTVPLVTREVPPALGTAEQV